MNERSYEYREIFRACTENKNIALRRGKNKKIQLRALFLKMWNRNFSHTHFILILFLPPICFMLQKRMRERTTISARQNKIPLQISPNFIKCVCMQHLFIPCFVCSCFYATMQEKNHFLCACGRKRERKHVKSATILNEEVMLRVKKTEKHLSNAWWVKL